MAYEHALTTYRMEVHYVDGSVETIFNITGWADQVGGNCIVAHGLVDTIIVLGNVKKIVVNRGGQVASGDTIPQHEGNASFA